MINSRRICGNFKNFKYLSNSYSSTVDQNELNFFNELSNEWWDITGSSKPLHSFNKVRIPFIREGLIQNGSVSESLINSSKVLKGLSILDVGCGGGILSEPLAKLGAKVTGLDASHKAIEIAKKHASRFNLDVTYDSCPIENHVTENREKYDAVVASEVLEHVTNREEFLRMCIQCLKPGGSILITTMNKTLQAEILGIKVAECIGLIPKGTHQIEKFVAPHELQRILEKYKCQTTLVHGFRYLFLTNSWCISSDTSINYGLAALKFE